MWGVGRVEPVPGQSRLGQWGQAEMASAHRLSEIAEPVHEIQEVHEDDEIDDDAVAVNLGPNRSHFKPFDVIWKGF